MIHFQKIDKSNMRDKEHYKRTIIFQNGGKVDMKEFAVITIDHRGIAAYLVKNEKDAVCAFANDCGLKVEFFTFLKAIENLDLKETITLFNQLCLTDDNKIRTVLDCESAFYFLQPEYYYL